MIRTLLLSSCLLAGCGQSVKVVTTPKRDVQCPVCLGSAALKDFDEYGARYECVKHSLDFDRHTGEFRRAREKTKAEIELEAQR